MKKWFASLVFFFTFFSVTARAEDTLSNHPRIIVHNRVLTNVHGNVISLFDVVKKLDMLFYRQYPEYLNSSEARYHFYMTHWKKVFDDLIDRELIMADAEEKNFKVSSGDVREELEDIFGPDIMLNLDSAGLSFEDAWQIVYADIMIRRMLYLQVRMPALAKITPQTIKKEYQEKILTSHGGEECTWRAISFRAETQEKDTLALANEAYMVLSGEKVSPEGLQKTLEARGKWDPKISMTISPPFTQQMTKLTAQLQKIFNTLSPGDYSKPLLQATRTDGTPVVRLYCIQDKVTKEPPLLADVQEELREELTVELITKDTKKYFVRLRNHFDVPLEGAEGLPLDFVPFEYK